MMNEFKVITLCGSTRNEIEYAKSKGKRVRFLE